MSTSLPELSLTLTEYEHNPDDRGDWAAFTACVSSCGFQGQSHFWVSREDLEVFSTALTMLDAILDGAAELVTGVGTTEYLRLRIEPYGKSGRLVVRAMVAAPTEARQRVHVEFVVLPNDLTAFRRALQALLEQRNGEARLVGDPEQDV